MTSSAITARQSLIKTLFIATRPRTFPLAVASIVCGTGLAYDGITQFSAHHWLVFGLSLWVALCLQILSNLANDYGDGIKGVDAVRDQSSPQRMTAAGHIDTPTFHKFILLWAGFTFCCGVVLLWIGFDSLRDFLLFLGFGIAAIIAAMAYTMGKRPYGYRAMGEVAVLIFFGWLGVLGSAYLQTHSVNWAHLLPATGCGGLAACVLYVNNMRDIYSDKQAGKITIAIILGDTRMQLGYLMLLSSAMTCYLVYGLFNNIYSLFWLVLIPAFFIHAKNIFTSRRTIDVKNNRQEKKTKIDTVKIGAELKRIVLLTLVLNITFVLGILVNSHL